MITPVLAPRLSPTDDSCLLTRLHAAPGDFVAAQAPLAEVELDKATLEITAPRPGYLLAFNAAPGQRVAIGDVIAWIADRPDEPIPHTSAHIHTHAPRLTHAAEALARDLRLTPDDLPAAPGILKRSDLLASRPAPPLPHDLPERLGPRHAILLGAGGHARAVLDLARQARPDLHILGALDDNARPGATLLDLPVLGPSTLLPHLVARGLQLGLLGVGAVNDPRLRRRLYLHLKAAPLTLPPLIHPRAIVEPSATIAPGAQLFAGAIVGAAATVGEAAILNAGAIVSHDCTIAPFAHLAPGAILAGGVSIGEGALIGMGATVYLGCHVGPWRVLPNGQHLTHDLP